jgi:hypothetical protein
MKLTTTFLSFNALCGFYSSSPLQPLLQLHQGCHNQVQVLQMEFQTCFANKLVISLSAIHLCPGTHISCTLLCSATVIRDCRQSQTNFELIWKESCAFSAAKEVR